MRTSSAMRWVAGIAATLLVPSLAYAHPGSGPTGGLLPGLAHPLTGLDHIAAMVAVGLWAAQRGGRAIWLVPVSFVAAMSVGGLLGATGVSLPLVEPTIIVSVLVLGLLVATAVRFPLVASSLLVALFAVFHGHAHGTEMPATAAGLSYGIGFVLGTGLLHGCGVGVGVLAQNLLARPLLVRFAGVAIFALGSFLLLV